MDGRRVLARALTVVAVSLALPAAANASTSVGSSVVGTSSYKLQPGVAAAFRSVPAAAGQVDSLNVNLDRASTAKSVRLGLYTGDSKRTRLAGCTVTSPKAGWNRCSIESTAVQAGKAYWLGVLQPARSSGRTVIRTQAGSGTTFKSTGSALKALPTTLAGKNDKVRATGSLYAAGSPTPLTDLTAKTSVLAADTQRPATPQGMAWNGVTATTVGLKWNATTDNVGVAGYRLFKDGVAVATTRSLSYTFTGLTCARSYTFALEAYDAAGNASYRAEATGTISTAACPADTQRPTTPSGLAANGITQTSIGVKWNAASDNVGVTGYRVSRNGTVVGTTTSLNYAFADLACNTSYTFGVSAYDAAGNASTEATSTLKTSACPTPTPTPTPTVAPDTQRPATPQGMAWDGVTQTSVGLKWNATTDNVGVAGYRLYRNGTAVGTTTALSYSFGGLTCGTSYTFALEAFDAAGNASYRAEATGTTSTAACTPTPTPTPTTTPSPTPTATPTATPTTTPVPTPTATPTTTPVPTPTATPSTGTANLWVNTSAGGSPQRCATACAYSASNAYGSFQAAVNAAASGDVIRVKTGRYGPQGSVGSASKTTTIIGEPGTTIDTGTGSGTYNHLNFSGNLTVEGVDIEGDYPLVLFSGANNTWRKSTFHSGRQIRRCNSDEPILIQGDNDDPADTIRNTTLQDIVIEQQKGSLAGQGGCPSNDAFHLEMIRIGRNVDGVKMDRVTFGPCPNGSNWVGCASGQLFITTTGGGAPPKNITLSNSRFYGAVNYHIQTHPNVGTGAVNWTLAYNTFGGNEPFTLGAAHGGVKLIGNLGTRPQNCSSNITYTKNVWQWQVGSPCGTDKLVTGPSWSTSSLGLNADLTLQAGSPAVDAGEVGGGTGYYCTSQLGSVDYDGHLRKVGTACDAGSDERQ